MNLILKRIKRGPDGIFSNLYDEKHNQVAVTLEHAYQKEDGEWTPKLYSGQFRCVRGLHKLHSMKTLFTTFEITGVENHSGILFHVGNTNFESNGCVLIGTTIIPSAITGSMVAFANFMTLQNGLEYFELTVI